MIKKWVAMFVLTVMLVFLGIQIYSFASEEHSLDNNLADIQTELAKAKTDEANLQSEDQYLADPANLEKALRAQFNYKKPGETMIIIVPASSTPTSTGTD